MMPHFRGGDDPGASPFKRANICRVTWLVAGASTWISLFMEDRMYHLFIYVEDRWMLWMRSRHLHIIEENESKCRFETWVIGW